MIHFRLAIIFYLLTASLYTLGQYGYVKLTTDSTRKGFIRSFRSVDTSEEGLEVWKTKTDKNPMRFFKNSISEYAIDGDTVKVIHDFTPFPDENLYFRTADARYVRKGKLNLLIIRKYREYMMIPGARSGVVGLLVLPKRLSDNPFIYVIEDQQYNQFKAIPFGKKELRKALLNFFPERFLELYEQKKERIMYRNLPRLIEFYNSKK